MATTQLTTADGHTLGADIEVPEGAWVGVVVCHPHPLYGGNRFNPVVDAVYSRLPALGLAALRFDFRRDHGGGTTEPLDVVAGLDELGTHTDGPLAVVGYSFGAAVALNTADPRIRCLVAIAPPLSRMSVAAPSVPTLVLLPRHDQYTSVDDAIGAVGGWPAGTLEIVESADHFLAGHTAAVGERAVDWVREHLAV